MAAKQGCGSVVASTPPIPPPMDVIFEILSWLPDRSLCRSRCVCTSWRVLISDPFFLAMHRSRAELLLIATTDSLHRGMPTTFVKIMDKDGSVLRLINLYSLGNLRASVNDIVLLTSDNGADSPGIRVVDLATEETIISFPRLAEVATRVTTWFGFGRAARYGACKVIRIVSRTSGFGHDSLRCEVLTVGHGSAARWRETRSPPSAASEYSFDYCNDGATVNGVVHFLSSTWQDGIVRFNLESEKWTAAIHRPRGGAAWRKEEISLAELNGALCIPHAKQHTVDLWLLADTNNYVWVNAYTVPVVHLSTELVPLSLMRGKILFYVRPKDGSPAVLKVYDPCLGKCSVVEVTANRIGLCGTHLDHRFRG